MLIRIPADQDFGRTDGAALRAAFRQRFALPQGRLRRPISLESLQILVWKTTKIRLRVSVFDVARATTGYNATYSANLVATCVISNPKFVKKTRTSF